MKELNDDFNRYTKESLRYRNTYNRLKMLATTLFEWENLPENLTPRILENMLYDNGEVFFFEHSTYGLLCLPSTPHGYNIYHEPVSVHVSGYNFSEIKNLSEGVRLLNNGLGYPTRNYIRDYAYRMTSIENAIEQNIFQQKFPYIIGCNKNKEFTLKTMFNKIQSGEQVIYANKDVIGNELQVYDLNCPFVADKLEDQRVALENQILTFLGMNNVNDKKERLVVDEANSNNEYIERNVEVMFQERYEGVKLLNERFGLNVSVKRKCSCPAGGDEDDRDPTYSKSI